MQQWNSNQEFGTSASSPRHGAFSLLGLLGPDRAELDLRRAAKSCATFHGGVATRSHGAGAGEDTTWVTGDALQPWSTTDGWGSEVDDGWRCGETTRMAARLEEMLPLVTSRFKTTFFQRILTKVGYVSKSRLSQSSNLYESWEPAEICSWPHFSMDRFQAFLQHDMRPDLTCMLLILSPKPLISPLY